MIRLIAGIFALALASSLQAAPFVVPTPPAGYSAGAACSAGYHQVGGRCVRNSTARASVRKCAAGLHLVGGRCIK
jgi:hypothetical protein